MENLVIYTKSYRNDVEKIKVLLDSTYKHNVDNIPIYVSCPSEDIEIFKNSLGTQNYILIPDEDIVPNEDLRGLEGWKSQQIVKSQFWKLGLCKNYFIIDSDGQFFKDIKFTDLMFDDNIPYTMCHEYKDLFEFMDKKPLSFDPYKSYVEERNRIMNIFGREGLIYDFGPIPLVWNTQVWKTLEEEYIQPNNLTFTDLIIHTPSEFTWYGEWFLYRNPIPLYPRGPIFKSYHFQHQYEYDKSLGYTIEMMKKLYWGVMLNTSWGAPLKY